MASPSKAFDPNNSELTENEEIEFVKLFDEVLERNRGDLSDECIEEGAEAIRERFRRGPSGACDKDQVLDTPENICGFFYRYSPLHAGVTRSKISTALRDCEELRSCFRRPSVVKGVDVGSAAGSGLVGLYSALYDGGFPLESLEMTLVEYNKGFENFSRDIFSVLSEGSFGNASKFLKEKMPQPPTFVCIDILKESDEYINILRKADIVFMKGLLSILDSDFYRPKVIEKAALAMRSGTLLVIVESPNYEKYFGTNSLLNLVFTTTGTQDESYSLEARALKIYDKGIARISNQEIYVFQKI